MNVLVVDDHPLVRTGIAAALQLKIPDAAIHEAGSTVEAVGVLGEHDIDVVTLDLRLEEGSGLEVARHIAEHDMSTLCVVFTSVASPHALVAAFNTGVVTAFLEKGVEVDPLAEAVQAASEGRVLLNERDIRGALDQIRSSGLDPTLFTPREGSIAELVADGLSDVLIARKLNISSSTVRNNLTTMYRKAGVESRTQLAALVWDTRFKLAQFS